MTESIHRIRKQVLEFNIPGSGVPEEAREKALSLWEQVLLPAIDRTLEAWGPAAGVLQLDTVRIELQLKSDVLDSGAVSRLQARLQSALKEELESHLRGKADPLPTPEGNFLEALVFFFREGYFPWWSGMLNTAEWHARLEAFLSGPFSKKDLLMLRKAFAEETVRKRITLQLEDRHFWALVKCIASGSFPVWEKDLSLLGNSIPGTDEQISLVYKGALMEAVSTEETDTDTINRAFARLMAGSIRSFPPALRHALEAAPLSNPVLKAKLTEAKMPDDKQPSAAPLPAATQEPTEQPLYVTSAGLVLIAPFLGEFFRRMEILDEDRLADIPRALALLHHAATGATTAGEAELALPKVLCGIPLAEPVATDYRVTADDRKNMEALLASVVFQWSVLKNTSVEGLREAFLQRDGRLRFTDGQWRLKVARKSYDMLIERLPWTLSIIRLPWMPHLLRVEW